MDNTIELINWSHKTGKCPVCKDKPSAIGITCGESHCFYMWLTRKPPMPINELRAIRAKHLGYESDYQAALSGAS
jgi:hypothetical protein